MVKFMIEIDDQTWQKFKDITPRSKKLKDAVVELIESEVFRCTHSFHYDSKTVKGQGVK